ncbi:Mannose-1-phosphate guanylyltransferase (GDP) [Paenibacillus pasadenensis]|uniref:Mannose-1-phosphate guanylyltransferase (GDP) n=1 Tax=Paenibacillus pasadenensis TaxID=217090 RepID=A0A2N5ND46_9BACL|nr:Mannose-1-phosphate guanylyltransferase (GDP) [Paenibacillus pasadenensis]
MSGGSGKRLWPLSNEIRSKLFLKLLPAPDGTLESMMQRLCRQLREEGLLEGAVIVTHRSQAEITRAHAGADVPIVEEPAKRGTFTAAALGAAYLAGPGRAPEDEAVCVLPVDLFVEADFLALLRRLPEALARGADLGMIGTEPTHPSAQYGYIVPIREPRPRRPKRRAAAGGRKFGGMTDAGAGAGAGERAARPDADAGADGAGVGKSAARPDADAGADGAGVGRSAARPDADAGGNGARAGRNAAPPGADAGADGAGAGWLPVGRFAEKPDPPAATRLIKQGGLWNSGVFVFRLGWLLGQLQARGYPSSLPELLRGYDEWSEKSFDQELAEKASRSLVLRYAGSWKDLGSWSTFLSQLGEAQLGPGAVSAGARNTHLINELGCPIHVIGISDAVVAASPDGILVASKEHSDRIKEALRELPGLPMQEEKRWGSCRTLEIDRLSGGGQVLTRRVAVHAGKCTSYHLHEGKEEVWTVLSGEGRFMLEDEIYPIGPGSVMRFPPGSRHGVKAVTELQCMQVEIGRVLDERDIERLLMSW